ncbi:hypothetical protein NZA98_26760, partial [Escherichia coli]|nr:hypothetical protein [Escherichia coli]
MTHIPIEIRRTAGRPQHSESDYARRRRLYACWHRRLGFTQRQLSALTGLSITTIAGYHSRTRKNAVPSDRTIFLMREEA